MTTDQWIIAGLIGGLVWMALGEWELRLIRKRLDLHHDYDNLLSDRIDDLDQRVFDQTAKDT